jgi:DNA-binding NarL/FixJ family response regulator
MDNIDVWIIEDNKDLLSALTEVVNSTPGMNCSRNFTNCEDVIATLKEESPPQVMLMDIGLPGMSGIEGVRHVKTISPATQVVMITVYEDNDKVFESICAGASGYLLKRVSSEKIIEAIREAHMGGAPMNAQIARKVLTMFTKLIAPQGDYALTTREREILNFLVSGLSQKMIADKLILSIFTIGTHIKNVYTKLQVHSRGEAVAKALKENLI